MRNPGHVVLWLMAGAITLGAPKAASGQSRPNIVFLYADDHAAHAISAYRSLLRYGVALPATPSLDRLAADGMLFVNSFVTNSICGPARATVLTGQYGHINGVMTNTEALHPTTVTFPKLLQAAGYQTALFGKWHLKSRPEGFSRYEILAGQGPYYNPTLLSATDTIAHTGYTLDIVTERALAWMRQSRGNGQPFMMMLSFNGPHRWWDPGPAYLDRYRDTAFAVPATFRDSGAGRASAARNNELAIAHDLIPRDLKLEPPNNLTPAQRAKWDSAYGPENSRFRQAALRGDSLAVWKYQRFIADYMRIVASLDEQVARVLAALDSAGLAGNTIVVYSSDQGFFLGDHGWFDKRFMYEESLRTPLIVRWPGVTRAGSKNRDLVMNMDLASTFLDIAGARPSRAMQGASLVPLLRGEKPKGWRDAIYYQYFEYPGWHMVRRQYGVRTSKHKLIHYYETGEWELFDLDADPEEMVSVYANPAYAPVVRTLKAKLTALRTQYAVPSGDPAPYYPWSLPPDYRRPGTPGSARFGEPVEIHVHPGAGMQRALRAADSLVATGVGKLYPGAVLLVARNDTVLHERAFGFTQLRDSAGKPIANPQPMKTTTLFDLASVTKVMATTFATMLLVDRQQLDLDSPVSRYLPDFRGGFRDSVTVRSLLNHSSGLTQWQPLYYGASNGAETYGRIRDMPSEWRVGSERRYSDLGFMLLGHIVERVSGKRLDQFLESELYKPLGLRSTTFNPRAKGFTEFAVTETGNGYERHMVFDSTFGYRYRGDPNAWTGWRHHVLAGEANDGNAWHANQGVAGHAGLFSTARELNALLGIVINRGAHAGRQVVSPRTVDLFLTADRFGHYLGWQMPAGMPPRSFAHTGFTGTYVAGVPSHGISVVLLTNRQNMGADARGYFPDLTELRAAVLRAIVSGAAADSDDD